MRRWLYPGLLFKLFCGSFKKEIASVYDVDFARKTLLQAKRLFNLMMRNPPDIDWNGPMVMNTLVAAFVASVYNAGREKITPDQMRGIMTKGLESQGLFKHFLSMNDYFCKDWQDQRNASAKLSQKREFSDDFVAEFVYGETTDEYGVVYHECGIYKLLKREGCTELAPFMCGFDYVMVKYMNATLKRTKTLATGGDCCDFWYTKKV